MNKTKSKKKDPPLTHKQQKEILHFHRLGFGTRRIQQKTGIGRKRVRTFLQSQQSPPLPIQNHRLSKLDPFRDQLSEKVQKGLSASRILRELRALGYDGGRTILALAVRSLRPKPTRRQAFRRFETNIAEEMQVDWSPYRVPIQGHERVVHAFGAILAYSRKEHIRFYPDETQPTLFEAHAHAFQDFGGVTRRIVYDRPATVVLGSIGRDRQPLWHPRFLEFAKHYGYEPYLCKPRDPNRKGKKEKFFQLLERDFLRGESFDSFQDLNARVRLWLDEVANRRLHGTTRRVPDEVFALEERPFLIPLPDMSASVAAEETRAVGPDSVLSIRGTPYSVPASLANLKVRVRLFAERFEVLDPNGEIAFSREYASPGEKGRLQIVPDHYRSLGHAKDCGAHAAPKEALLVRFPDLEDLLAGIQLHMKSLAPIHLRALLRMADTWGDKAFREAALRAQSFRRFDAYAVRRILEQAHPLPLAEPEPGLSAAARVLLRLGDVDQGSLDDYAHLDQAAPKRTESEGSDGGTP